jgi:hypothetical protein
MRVFGKALFLALALCAQASAVYAQRQEATIVCNPSDLSGIWNIFYQYNSPGTTQYCRARVTLAGVIQQLECDPIYGSNATGTQGIVTPVKISGTLGVDTQCQITGNIKLDFRDEGTNEHNFTVKRGKFVGDFDLMPKSFILLGAHNNSSLPTFLHRFEFFLNQVFRD